jgi:signal transduction histidine kinase
MQFVPFQTRARTIDHLGRGQIADCPTAISELWKNAYDAYARNVALHIFDGDVAVAGLLDDGHGMTRDEFLDRWLVVGTEAKVTDTDVNEDDRNGLPQREKQGEKGIGRLSVAYLGPTVLVLSKRSGHAFVAALVDWRLFENPHLSLSDVRIPVEECAGPDDFRQALKRMFDGLLDNVRGKRGESDRKERIKAAWDRYSRAEKTGEGGGTTAAAIEATVAGAPKLVDALLARHLREWSVWTQDGKHGTALFVFDIHHELGVWVDPNAVREDSETDTIRRSLRDTLTGFTDPYVETGAEFDYKVVVHTANTAQVVVSATRRFGLDDLLALEHVVIGDVDEHGVFRGRIKAFGRELGEVSLPPARTPPLRKHARVGPFSICIATFEQELERSTHPPEVHHRFKDMTDLYAGLAIYRDGLRVMPYGRPDADYFGIEERRSLHAGRAFWSYRRTFGRVALTRTDNPNLRDKAGREGLIDNRAKRELRILVVDLLKQTAGRYFNLESPTYREMLPGIMAANRAAREAEEKIRQRRSTVFRQAIRKQAEPLARAVEAAEAARVDLQKIAADGDEGRLIQFEATLDEIHTQRADLRPPPRPPKLGKLEGPYREYRDRYNALCAIADELSREWEAVVERLHRQPPDEEARSVLGRQQSYLHQELRRWQSKIEDLLKSELKRTAEAIDADRRRFYVEAAPLITELLEGRMDLSAVLRQMEEKRNVLQVEFDRRYGSYATSLEQLAEGIDLDALITWSGEQREELQSRLEQLNALAQLGITVEIVGHELDTIDADIARHLQRFPENVRRLAAFRDMTSAHKALVDRLRFLAPMKLSGPRLREEITGERIFQYVTDFFRLRLESSGILLAASDTFRSIRIREYPSRLLPVFINLVNNSLYWLNFRAHREIRFDTSGDLVIVADSGPGIDADDQKSLFRLFFSRRVEGRGVGLYLCRANLAAGGHTIEYATGAAHRILDGANFVICFQGISHD